MAAHLISIAPTRTKYFGRHSWKAQRASRTELADEENSWIELTGTEKLKLPGSTQNCTEKVQFAAVTGLCLSVSENPSHEI